MLVSTTLSADVSGTSVQTKTVLRHEAVGQQTEVIEWSVSFTGILSTDHKPLVEIMKDSIGNGTSTARTPVRIDPGTGAVTSTARENFTVEPATPGTPIIKERVHPQAGYTWRGSLPVKAGGTCDIRVTGAGEAWTCMARFIHKE